MRISFFIAIIFLLGFFGLGYMHEQVHVEIFASYGIESHVEYFLDFPNFVTIAEEPCPTDACILAHNINEAIGYPLLIVYSIFGIILFAGLCFKEADFELEKFKLKIEEKDVKK